MHILNSSGDIDARNALVNSGFWRVTVDGRATVAMAELIEQIRTLKAAGADVRIVAMDADWSKGKTPGTRDETMAANIEAALDAMDENGKVIILAGDVHTSRVEKHPFAGYTPMGYLLATKSVIAFNASHDGGTSSTYGAPAEGRSFSPSIGAIGAKERALSLFGKPDGAGYAGIYHVGRISASPHVAKAWLGL